ILSILSILLIYCLNKRRAGTSPAPTILALLLTQSFKSRYPYTFVADGESRQHFFCALYFQGAFFKLVRIR
ncbi:MAG: hypothetical protein WBP93_06970, partial [Pyrinomonadaceae bacterium]